MIPIYVLWCSGCGYWEPASSRAPQWGRHCTYCTCMLVPKPVALLEPQDTPAAPTTT